MPLQGVFNADFTAFTTACAQAEASLKGFETGAGKTETALNRMADSISGQKIVQQAMLATKAVEDVGGAAVLTDKELARMSAIAAEGVEKLRLMGQEVPAGMQALARETQNAAVATSGWSSALSTAQGYLSAFGISATVGGLVSFTEKVFSNASAIHDMGERLGISAEAVQGFQFAAEQAGSSLDAVGSAITKMNKNLAEGDKSTVEALARAGLSFQDIRSMKPEDAFLAITDAIAQMPDPMERSDVTLKLFGKSAAELLPAITEGFRQAADSATKMSNETVNSLERAEDAWSKLSKSVVISTGTVLATTIDATSNLSKSWGNFVQFLENAQGSGLGVAAAIAVANERIGETVAFVGPLQEFARGMHQTKDEIDAAEKASTKFAEAWTVLNSLGTSYEDTVAQIDKRLAEQASYYLRVGASVAEVAAAFPKLTAAQVKALDEMVKNHDAMLKKIEALEADHTKKQETNYLGLSQAENDASQKRIEAFGKANDQIEKLNQQLTDDYNKQTMSRADYEDAKLWESAQQQIDAFKATGATAQQVTEFSDKLYEATATKAAEIQYTATTTLDNITQQGIDDMKRLVDEHAKAMAAAKTASSAALETLQGGTKLPGSSVETAFGQNYIVSSMTGARIPMGPHGEVPKNFDALYTGKSNFPQFASGVENFGGGLAVVGERGPELVNLPAGSDVIPRGVGGSSIVQHIYVTQPLGTPEAIARAVADAQVGLMRGQGIRLPYGT